MTLGQQSTGRFYSRHMHMMGDMAIIGGYMKSTVNPSHTETAETKYGTSDEFELRGPFSRTDPDGSEGISIYESVKKYYRRARPRHQNMFEVAFGSDARAGLSRRLVGPVRGRVRQGRHDHWYSPGHRPLRRTRYGSAMGRAYVLRQHESCGLRLFFWQLDCRLNGAHHGGRRNALGPRSQGRFCPQPRR